MSEDLFPVPADWASATVMTRDRRAADHARSLGDSAGYWLEQAQRLDWITPPTRASESSFAEGDFGVKWFADGVLNVSVNCIDRHLAQRGEATAIIWEPDDPAQTPRRFTYRQLHEESAASPMC
jgi:acetyl-CoA synthetase